MEYRREDDNDDREVDADLDATLRARANAGGRVARDALRRDCDGLTVDAFFDVAKRGALLPEFGAVLGTPSGARRDRNPDAGGLLFGGGVGVDCEGHAPRGAIAGRQHPRAARPAGAP